MVSIGIALYGDPFHDIIRDDIVILEKTLTGYIDMIQALGEPSDVRIDIGEPRSDPKLLEVVVKVDGLPKTPSEGALILPGINDDIPDAIRANVQHQVEQFCEDHDIDLPKFTFQFPAPQPAP